MAGPPETLEALVKDELRGPVSDLVRRLVPELVAEALNGTAETGAELEPRLHRAAQVATNGPGPIPEPAPVPTTKVCTVCGRSKGLVAFQHGGTECRKCRGKARAREPQAEAADAGGIAWRHGLTFRQLTERTSVSRRQLRHVLRDEQLTGRITQPEPGSYMLVRDRFPPGVLDAIAALRL